MPRVPSIVLVAAALAFGLPVRAGDILRGGSPTGGSKRTAVTGANAGAEAAARTQANARDRLSRTTQTLDAMKALQAAARRAASRNPAGNRPLSGQRPPVVFNGLGRGGLQVAPGVPGNLDKLKPGENRDLWVGAKLPTQTGGKGGKKTGPVNVTIVQTEQQAILNWETFNIGKKTTLTFDQSAGGAQTSQWVAFNKVNDPTGKPSQILGSIKADGQVYVINQNGIIFGGRSQVNVHTLVASALPINDNLIARGLLDNPDAEFLFSARRVETLLDRITDASPSAQLGLVLDARSMPLVTAVNQEGTETVTFTPRKDYTLATGEDRKSTVTFTEAGLEKLAALGKQQAFSVTYNTVNQNVVVERGARLFSPASAAKVGGRIMLVGANVRNDGTILTPDGQTILAAGLQVGIDAHKTDDPSIRGLDVYVGRNFDPAIQKVDYAGTATNRGLIDVPRGSVTITGKDVRQLGVIESRTSVSLNGSIRLFANYDAVTNFAYDAALPGNGLPFLFESAGTVTLGAGSSTRILPEIERGDAVIGRELALQSRVDIQGHAVHLAANAVVLAPNADVNVDAGVWSYIAPLLPAAGDVPQSRFVHAGGQIYVDRGALIDVSGTTGVETALAQNILTLKLRGAEFSDSPLQRGGLLRGPEITIDLRESGIFNGLAWVGTPLANATGYRDLILRTVAELTLTGGSVDLAAGGSIILQKGATIDVSGGWQRFGSGFVETTRVMSGGRLIDIADATPDLVYDGIYTGRSAETHATKWGVTRTFTNPLTLSRRHFESASIKGHDGGSIALTAPSMALDGRLLGSTTTGTRQLRNSSKQTELPVASRLSLTFKAQDATPYHFVQFPDFSPARPKVVFAADFDAAAADPFALDALGNPVALSQDREKLVVLSPELVNRDGFGFLSIDNRDGRIVLPSSVSLDMQPRVLDPASKSVDAATANIDFKAANIDLRGKINAPGGILSFTAYDFSPYEAAIIASDSSSSDFRIPLPNPTRGTFLLRPGAALSTAGRIVDDRLQAPSPETDPLAIRGGAINIQAYDVLLRTGSLLDVSGGVAMNAKSVPTYGNAGAISIKAGQDPGIASLLGGKLVLGSTLQGYSGGTGGSLAIQAPLIRVGRSNANSRVFAVAPEFFDRGGFTSFSLTGIGSRPFRRDPFASGEPISATEAFRAIPANRALPGLTIEPGTILSPVVQSWLAQPLRPGESTVTLEPTLRPEGLRSPVSLSFGARGVTDGFSKNLLFRGDLLIGQGVVVNAGALGTVDLKADIVSVRGSILAPGGAIRIAGAGVFPEIGTLPQFSRTTVYLGPGSRLDVAGRELLVPNEYGYRKGSVLAGGTIDVTGNILADARATLDVSGASGMLDLSPAQVGLSAYARVTSGLNAPLFDRSVVPTRVDSDGGTIRLAGATQLFVDAQLRGAAGGPTAMGGSLEVSSGQFLLPDVIATPKDVTLVVTQSDWRIPADFDDEGRRPIGSVVRNGAGLIVPGRGYFAIDRFTEGGFDSLALGGVVRFRGPVEIAARRKLSVASGGFLYANDDVTLAAPYVQLGTPFLAPLAPLDPARTAAFTVGGQPFYASATYGPGRLTVRADLIDVGNLSLQRVGLTRLVAAGGDIRGDGTLEAAGHIVLRAGQIYPASGTSFTIAAFDYREIAEPAPAPEPGAEPITPAPAGPLLPGSVTIRAGGSRQLPLSAGGELSIYGTKIEQAGTLRAPLGTLTIGHDGSGETPRSALSGRGFAVTDHLRLATGSETSVSAADRGDGLPLLVPYGVVVNDTSWIDPHGVDITGGGVPAKDVRLGAKNVTTERGSVIDLRGGGDLYAYNWVTGLGGTRDILSGSESFAVLPGYGADYAPFAPFNTTSAAGALNGNPGYVNDGLQIGDRVFLGASNGLAAGTYTLLPARYALLPGAVLVTPRTSAPVGTLAQADGSSLVAGYRYNSLGAARPNVLTQFEVAPAAVVRARAEYHDYAASRFLRQSARTLGVPVPRLPLDAGHLVFQATETLRLRGAVWSDRPEGGIGAFVDISSPANIVIVGSGEPPAPRLGTLVLRAANLTAIGAESLLVGGVRTATGDGVALDVQTGSLTLDNAGTPLAAPEVILAARDELTLAPRAVVSQTGQMAARAERLLVEGDGALLRVSSDPEARVARTGVTAGNGAVMTIGAGVRISGTSLLLDSSAATALDPGARLLGDYVSLNSGQITLRLADAGELAPTTGLVLAGEALRSLRGVEFLSLLSYTSLDIYGRGGLQVDGALELHAGEIRGFHTGKGGVTFTADDLLLDNRAGAGRSAAGPTFGGTLAFEAGTIRLGTGRIDINQYASVDLTASRSVKLEGAGQLFVRGDMTITAPFVAAADSARARLAATGTLQLLGGGKALPVNPGLGGSLTLRGETLRVDTDIYLPSGELNLQSSDGDISVGGRLFVDGSAQSLYDLVKYTGGGRIDMASTNGSVLLRKGSVVSVAAQAGGGDGGGLSIATPHGRFEALGTLLGAGGRAGRDGTFSLDVGSLAETRALNDLLNAARFTESRSIRVREGDVLVNGTAESHAFHLSADAGSIIVDGTIDASGRRGGNIQLSAAGSLTLLGDSELTVAAGRFDAAGKGGAIFLEAGAPIDGVSDATARLGIRLGSVLDLTVASANDSSASLGRFTGTLHLRAPQTVASDDVQIDPLDGTIRGASSIIVEGSKIFDLTGTGLITTAVRNAVRDNAIAFIGTAGTLETPGTPAAGYGAMHDRLLANNAALGGIFSIRAGAELINRDGNLTLGTTGSNGNADWNFQSLRFGPQNAPGILTLRATGNLVFYNSLQDGFNITSATSAYTARLMASNPLLPMNAQSWSFHLTAGADLGAADFHRVQPIRRLAADSGSLKLGKNAGAGVANPFGANATVRGALGANGERYQVIRTGSGEIDISAGRDVQLLNPYATIYTAGTLVDDPTLGGAFEVPVLSNLAGGALLGGAPAPVYRPQYTLGGGNVILSAQGDIIHLTRNTAQEIIADSQRQLPTNWLYRRGYVDPATGEFGVARGGDIASTSWWIDFSNFFQGIGALGGGNVSLFAGHNVENVDAVVPTNARMPGGRPDAARLVELGGGDLTVRAGKDIDAGVYYVERGVGELSAGNTIHTNHTRSPSRGNIISEAPFPEESWLPTTLFVGKGRFDVSARGDVLLGPVANPFLLPGGYNNTYWNKTYFSTYAPDTAVNVTSTGGSVTLRQSTNLPGEEGATPLLYTWYRNVLLLGNTNPSFYQPWLRLNETSVESFRTVTALLPGTLRATAFAGDINVVGNLTLAPAPRGTLDLLAGGSLNGLQPNGVIASETGSLFTWSTTRINLSDASPRALPQIQTPYANQLLVGTSNNDIGRARTSAPNILASVDKVFLETGSLDTVLDTKQTLHGRDLLHAGDRQPVRLYARAGDISGVTLFSPKATRVLAGNDIADIAFYLQNVAADDVSVVAAGRDIIPFTANSPLRTAALTPGNIIIGEVPLAGDIQVGGPGFLEVLAGRNLDLGIGENNADGTGVGIVTIGNARNPYLGDEGAAITAGAGMRASAGLASSPLRFQTFVDEVLETPEGVAYVAEALGLSANDAGLKRTAGEILDGIPRNEQTALLMKAFFVALRETGRNFNNPASPGYGNYDAGFAAIASLLGSVKSKGDINTRSRDIRTKAGGDITILAPGGKLTLSQATLDNQLAPPGIITETGGDVRIFTKGDVDIGIGRIFTLRGGDLIIWSSTGDIAAGAASKTVASAPPTRVIIDPQSADLKTDLAGLATGGGIGVLATVEGVPPGDVDLIAPTGVIDAGDAGIRVSGNINLAATEVLNADNIAVSGASIGVPTAAPPSSAPIAAPPASNASAANNNAANELASQARPGPAPEPEPSTITVEVLGYGGEDGEGTSASAAPTRDGA